MPKQTIKEALAVVDQEHVDFQRAIGGLILAFANLESVLYSVLRHYAGVSHDVGRAIFSGSRRAKTMIDFIRSIAHNTQLEDSRRSDLEEVFLRINPISEMRDTIIHHVDGSEHHFDEDDLKNRYLTKHFVSRRGNELVFKLGSATIDAMSSDLIICCWRLAAHTDNTNKDPFKPGFGFHGAQEPWLYTPLQPHNLRKQTPKDAPKQPRQQKSSRR